MTAAPARILARHERFDVGDVTDALAAPPRRDAHSDRHLARARDLNDVHERVVGAVEAYCCEGKRPVEGVLRGRVRDPTPALDRARRADIDEVVRQFGARAR